MTLLKLRPAAKVVELEKFSDLPAAIIRNGEPSLFVIDLLLPDVRGTSAISNVRQLYAEASIAVISSMPANEVQKTCIKAGADAYIEKSATVPHIMQVLHGLFTATSPEENEPIAEIKLSKRQKQLIVMLDRGLSNKSMADELDISEHTIKVHLWRLFRRVGVNSRTQVLHFARKAKERADEITHQTGRKPGKKEMREIKEDVKMALLPVAFSKESKHLVWIAPEAGLLIIEAAGQAKADEIITQLVKTIANIKVGLVFTTMSPQAAMANWLITQEAPDGFSVDRECELKALDESKAVVKFAKHSLDRDDVRKHIEEGKLPTRLAMTWDSRVSFVLTETMQLKKISFLDVVFENRQNDQEDGFDADVAIATGELRKVLPDLFKALGGVASWAS